MILLRRPLSFVSWPPCAVSVIAGERDGHPNSITPHRQEHSSNNLASLDNYNIVN